MHNKDKRFSNNKLVCVVLLLLVIMAQLQPVNSLSYDSSSERILSNQIDFGRQFMPPNPETYPDFYKDKGENNNQKWIHTMEEPDIINGSDFISDIQYSSAAPNRDLVSAKKLSMSAGTVEKVLVIPIAFSNESFDAEHNTAYYQALMNQMKDYYEQNSQYVSGVRGISINAMVVNPVTSSRTMEYYGQDSDTVNGGIDDIHPVEEMAREAVQKLNARGFDFSSYDRNSDSYIDHIFIIHAGSGQEEIDNSNFIWSCRSEIENGQSVDGKMALNFITIPENGALGVCAHEFGHDLGLPDLYDTDGIGNGYTLGVGDWDLMGSGSWNYLPGDEPGTCPSNLSAWCKMSLGWLTPTNISANGTYTLTNTAGNNQAYKLWTGGDSSGSEYYLAEYRRNNGYDAGLPGEGLLVWHIDKQWIDAASPYNLVNAYEGRLGVELEQADGNWDLWWLINSGDAGDPFTGVNCDEGLNNFTALPYNLNYSNITPSTYSYVEIRNVNTSGSAVTADYFVASSTPAEQPVVTSLADDSIVLTPATFSWNMVNQAQKYRLQTAQNSSFTTDLVEYYLDGSEDENLEYTGDGYTFTLPSSRTLIPGQTYYWRVAGINDISTIGNTVWSETRNFVVENSSPQADSFLKEDMPTGRNGLGAVVVNNQIYAVGGYTGGVNVLATLEVYDPETDTWVSKASMPTARENIAVVELDNIIYVIGGDTAYTSMKTVEAYDPETDTWTTKADLLSPKTQFAAVAVNGKIYAIGGSGSWDDFEEYDPQTDTWTKKADPLYEISGNPATVINGKIYVIGGSVACILQVYDPTSDTWSTETNPPTKANFGGAVSIGDRIYVLGGLLSAWEPNVIEYNTISKEWTPMPNLRFERFSHAVAVINNSIFVLGGRNTGTFALNSVEEYIPLPGSDLNTPQNLNEEAVNDNGMTITWDEVDDATGYYVLTNDQEVYTATNSYTINSLSPNKTITYKVRAVDTSSTSDWSEVQTASTTGIPEITAAANITESSENGAIITVTLINGVFRSDGIYNKATVILDPDQLPQGVKEGSVTRINDNTLQIALVGNRTEDYDSDISVDVIVSKQQISTGRYFDPSDVITFDSTIEVQPPAPSITFSFDGDDAGKLMGITSSMEFSLDGGNTYIVAVTSDQALTANQLALINAANDIRVRITEPTGEDCIISILSGPAAPSVTADNTADTIAGIDNTMEFSTDGVNWTKFDSNLPGLTGNITIQVRIPGHDVTAPGTPAVLTFTAAAAGGGMGGGGGGGGGGAIPEEEPVSTGTEPVEVEAAKPLLINGTDIAKTSVSSENINMALDTAEKNQEGIYELVVNIQNVNGANGYAISLPTNILTVKSEEAGTTIQINSSVGTVILPNNMIQQASSDQLGKEVELVMSKVDKDKLPSDIKDIIGDRPVIDIHLNINGQNIAWNNPDAPVTLSIDYKPTQVELAHPDNIVVWYIDGNGNAVEVPSGKYDSTTGKVTFTTTHFSQYAVAYYSNLLTDIKGYAWAEKEIVSMVGKGVIRGETETTFKPGDNITRAEFLYGLVRALGLAGTAESNFEDINITDYYYQEIAIAKELGISNGNGANRFGPDEFITRQDMMTLMARALKLTNKLSPQSQTADLNQFADNKLIALYAKDSIVKVVAEGIIKGDGKNINPLKNTTRAEAAVILYRIYNK